MLSERARGGSGECGVPKVQAQPEEKQRGVQVRVLDGDRGSWGDKKQGRLGVSTPLSGSRFSPSLTTQPPHPPVTRVPSCSLGSETPA